MKMNLKKVRKLFLALVFAMLIPAFILKPIFPSLWPLWLVLILGLGAAAIAVDLALWRCPHCGANLGRDAPKFCPSCGHRLDNLQ